MDDRIDILGLDFDTFSRLAAAAAPATKGSAGKLYARAFSTGRLEPRELGLSERNAAAWEESFRVGLLEPRRTVAEEGEFGTSVKAVFGLADGGEIECVRIPMPPRADGTPRESICVSSQLGCRMGCAFCETGRGGLVRNLSAAEILSQVVTARVLLGWESGNVVFMGMGEPLDNLGEVARALRVLTEPRGLGLSWERITVCTSGGAGNLDALRELGHPRLNLSLSLNAADDATRERLMPSAARQDLARLAERLKDYPRRPNFVLALNWCLLPGINDTREDARRAASFAASVGRCVFNLIPYNPGTRPIARAPSGEEVERFGAWLREEGCHVKLRAAKGAGIMAACGQLGGPAAGARAAAPDAD